MIFIVAAAAAAGLAQEQLLSSQTAHTFYDVGYELYSGQDAGYFEAKQAVIFFSAATNLDSRANYVLPDFINIAWKYPEENLSDAVQVALNEYMDRTSDLEITSRAVQYLVERLSSREEREQLLVKLLNQYNDRNQFFTSDILAGLGFFKAETAETVEAQRYLMRAYAANRYNRLAFDRLAELAETGGEELPIIVYLENFRYLVRANPLDFKSAIDFARYSESLGLYEPAAAAYKYCSQLYKYLKPGEQLPAEIYRPWILNCYNVRNNSECRQILEQVRGYDRFDIMVEAVAAASARQSGDTDSSKAIIDSIRGRARKILAGQLKASAGEMEDFAWFFNFASEVNDTNSEDMLTWATKAYDADNNSISAGSFFAYALAKNDQIELAESVIKKIGIGTQASAIAQALITAAKNANDINDVNDANSAVNILKSAINAAPGTFESQKAKLKLKELGSEYVSAIDPVIFTTVLKNDFGTSIFSEFVPPEKMITVQLKTGGSAFSYGSDINADIVIINNSSEPMVICPEAMFKGVIRVDAVLSGDLSERMDNLIVKTIRPSDEIKPGGALFVPVRLATGRLKCIMDCYPQADLNIEVTAYTDPQTGSDGKVSNPYGIKPAKAVIKRRKLDLNARYFRQKLDAIEKGYQGQKIKSAQLFAGLLAEQQKLSKTGPKYRFIYAEPELLTSAIAKCMSDDDWVLKVETMAAILKLKLDYRLTNAVSAELHNPNWPVRLMAIFVLAENQGTDFRSVLKWTSENDSDPIVKEMALALSESIKTDGKTTGK